MAHYRLVFGRLDKRPCLKNGILNNPSVLPNIKSESFDFVCIFQVNFTLFAYSPAKLTLPCGRCNSSCVVQNEYKK